MDRASHPPLTETAPSLGALFRVFLILGMTSFGGGLSGWIHREIVVKRRWLSNERLLAGIAMLMWQGVLTRPNGLHGARAALRMLDLAAPAAAIGLNQRAGWSGNGVKPARV